MSFTCATATLTLSDDEVEWLRSNIEKAIKHNSLGQVQTPSWSLMKKIWDSLPKEATTPPPSIYMVGDTVIWDGGEADVLDVYPDEFGWDHVVVASRSKRASSTLRHDSKLLAPMNGDKSAKPSAPIVSVKLGSSLFGPMGSSWMDEKGQYHKDYSHAKYSSINSSGIGNF